MVAKAKRRRARRRRRRRKRRRKRKTYLRSASSSSSVVALAAVNPTPFPPLAPATPIVSPAQPPSRLLRAQTCQLGGLPGGGLFWGWLRQPRGATRATLR
jgi:hypothetical protein